MVSKLEIAKTIELFIDKMKKHEVTIISKIIFMLELKNLFRFVFFPPYKTDRFLIVADFLNIYHNIFVIDCHTEFAVFGANNDGYKA